MKTITIVAALIAAIAAGGVAWQTTQALERAKAELASANSQLQQARTAIQAMEGEIAGLRRELGEQKTAAEQLRAELAAAKSFLEAEKAIGARLRDELIKTKEQLAMVSRQRALQAAPVARPVQVQPTVIRALRPGAAIGAGAPAGQ